MRLEDARSLQATLLDEIRSEGGLSHLRALPELERVPVGGPVLTAPRVRASEALRAISMTYTVLRDLERHEPGHWRHSARNLGVATGAVMAGGLARPRTVAIGITPSDRDEHRLAVRILGVTPTTLATARHVVDSAAGEADVAVLGRLIPHTLLSRLFGGRRTNMRRRFKQKRRRDVDADATAHRLRRDDLAGSAERNHVIQLTGAARTDDEGLARRERRRLGLFD